MDNMDSVITQDIEFECKDAAIKGQLFAPLCPPRHAIVIHAATGVPQTRYVKFARWLTEAEQAAVLIYDYRDMGRSAQGHLKNSKLKMSDWGVDDQSAALDWLVDRHPDLPVTVIGHSLGGLFVPWHAKAENVSRVIAIASGPAYVSRHPLSYMPQVLLFWYALGPALVKLFGYLPGKLSGLGSDLPANVYWQWRRWCTSRQFNRVDWGKEMPVPDLTRVKADVFLFGMADDVMIPPACGRLLAQYYPAAKVRFTEIFPASYGLSEIGHINVFSERCKAVWPVLMGRGGVEVCG